MSLSVECCSSQGATSGHHRLGGEAASTSHWLQHIEWWGPEYTNVHYFGRVTQVLIGFLTQQQGEPMMLFMGILTQISWVWKKIYSTAAHWCHNLFTSITQSLKRKWKCEWQNTHTTQNPKWDPTMSTELFSKHVRIFKRLRPPENWPTLRIGCIQP